MSSCSLVTEAVELLEGYNKSLGRSAGLVVRASGD